MMTCCSATACACSRSPRRSACARPAGRWASTTSTYYRWKRAVDRWGLEALRVREPPAADAQPDRPPPRAADPRLRSGAAGVRTPADLAELRRSKWGGIAISEHGSGGCLGVLTSTLRQALALVARHADPYERRPEIPPPERHIDASEPGEKVQMDCFSSVGFRARRHRLAIHRRRRRLGLHLGRAAFIRSQPQGPLDGAALSPVAADKAAGWKLREGTRQRLGVRIEGVRSGLRGTRRSPGRIKAGRPNSNGCVERAQLTILEECWRPAFARSLAPKITALRRDLDEYLSEFNFDRAHNGRLTRGRVPGEIVHGARKMGQVR